MPKKILIIAPAWVGDLVMSQALFKRLKQQDPSAIIDVLALPWAASFLTAMPEVNQIINMPLGHGVFGLKQRWQLGVSLRKNKYDQAIILPNSWKSALIPFAARIPKRTGWLGECRWGLLNDVYYLDKKQFPLMVQRFLALGFDRDQQNTFDYKNYFPAFEVSADRVNATLKKFDCEVSENFPVLILCPGAEYGPAKRWPPEYFAKVAQIKLNEGWQIWILGGSKEQAIADEIQILTEHRCKDFTGKTNLGEAVDLMSQAKCVVTNDSGLMHIAAALSRPMVAIYGSSSPEFTPPLSNNVKILWLHIICSPCFQRECPLGHLNCLKHLYPEMVLEAIS